MSTDHIILSSVASLSVAAVALFMSFFQGLIFFHRSSYAWNGWGAVISLATAFHAAAVFIQYNTPPRG